MTRQYQRPWATFSGGAHAVITVSFCVTVAKFDEVERWNR